MSGAVAVMVCGTTSGAGKSLLATALARWYARQGLKVAPFKAQNMSNNARVVAGGEIGSAQYFQALAARCTPEVRMNPVLLKPERDTHSQLVVLGQRNDRLGELPWRERSDALWPIVHASLQALQATHEVLVIEGAGSPAEINLQASDIVNMRIAAAAGAATLIVCDIDRGGAFAHLFGTHQLLPAGQRRFVRGFVLNKFRGDARLLTPGPELLAKLTGVPTLGVLPMWREHGLPEEDGVFDATDAGDGRKAAIIAYPHISNLDEFAPLRRVPDLRVCWARQANSLADAHLLILPGSKHVANDLAWLRSTGLDAAIAAHVRAHRPTLAICGGLQMLGAQLRDPHAVEGAAAGLHLAPYSTEFQLAKTCVQGRYRLEFLSGYWQGLSGVEFSGYEIRHGRTHLLGEPEALRAVLPDGAGWQFDNVLALYTHGLFENATVLKALFGASTPTLEDTLNGLADFLEAHIAPATLLGLLRP